MINHIENKSMENMREIKAETLISLIDVSDFTVQMQGIFFRNYSEDLTSITDDNNGQIFNLSRDGIFHLLPEGLFFEKNQLKDDDFKKKYDALKEKKKRIDLFFQPFDTEYFKLSLKLEKKINAVSEQWNAFFSTFFFDNLELEHDNAYIYKLKTLLPYVSELKGNHKLLVDILKIILECEKVEIIELKPFFKRFIFHKECLSKEAYQQMTEKILAFFNFFQEWFLPFEIEYDYRIKDRKQRFYLGKILLLDYNTNL
jgi:hypothetical protein